MKTKVKRGRPSKNVLGGNVVSRFKPSNDFKPYGTAQR